MGAVWYTIVPIQGQIRAEHRCLLTCVSQVFRAPRRSTRTTVVSVRIRCRSDEDREAEREGDRNNDPVKKPVSMTIRVKAGSVSGLGHKR